MFFVGADVTAASTAWRILSANEPVSVLFIETFTASASAKTASAALACVTQSGQCVLPILRSRVAFGSAAFGPKGAYRVASVCVGAHT